MGHGLELRVSSSQHPGAEELLGLFYRWESQRREAGKVVTDTANQ